jgi:uncharacterized protein (TIGR00251 family)
MISDAGDGAIIEIRVVPRAGRTGLAGSRSGKLLVRLAAAPVEGAANAELVTFLSELLDVPKRQISILSGEKGRQKRVKISGVTPADVRRLLDAR